MKEFNFNTGGKSLGLQRDCEEEAGNRGKGRGEKHCYGIK